jgi:hypothetical protein
MCALLAIVQYEVHYFQEGRWLVQSRYPGDQRQEAIKDAQSVEATTRRPTKVIKDTYLPHENRNETVTVYVGALLKAAMEKAKAQVRVPPHPRGTRTPAAAAVRHTRMAQPRIAQGAVDLFWRGVIALGLSLGAATIVTAMVSWLVSRLPDFGVHLDPANTSAMLTLTYAGVFLFGVFSMFRFGAPIKRMIAALWRSSIAEKDSPVARASMPGSRLKPKRAPQVPFERARDIAEVKRGRGDLDTLPPEPEIEIADTELIEHGIPVIAETPPPVPAPPAPPQPAQPDPAIESKAGPTSTPTVPAQPAPAPANAASAPIPTTSFNPAINELQRSMALRFVAEVVLPQVAHGADDPVARRGAALFVTGAMSQLAGVSNLSPLLAMSLISSAVMAALPRHAVDAYLSQYEAHITGQGNSGIIEDGKHAMARFLAGQSNDGALAAALQRWRVPLPAATAPAPAASGVPPTDYYLLTDFRHGDAFMMDFHNSVVRQALESSDGREIKHTGRGILARFEFADFAIQAASTIQQKISTSPGVPETVFYALALVGGYGAADDPLLSPNIIKTAQGALDAAPRGLLICQPRVFSASHASDRFATETFNAEWITIREKRQPVVTGPAA